MFARSLARRRLVTISFCLVTSVVQSEALTAKDVELPPASKLLFWPQDKQSVGYRNIDRIYATRPIKRGETVYPLPKAGRDLALTFEHDGRTWTVGDLMKFNNVAGLIVVKDGKVVFEKYDLGNTETTVWNSFGMATSVTSMLVGAAIADGKIRSVDDRASAYLSELEGTVYDGVTIRQLLTMTSGIEYNEDYTQPSADVNKILGAVADGNRPGFIVSYMAKLPRAHPPGSTWSYVTGDMHVLGAVLSAAIGKNLSDYLSETIWAPFGMEHDASWMLESKGGLEFAGCCISATLRDYARLGQFMLENGRAGGKQALPETWVNEATAPSSPMKGAFGYAGYGYAWWAHADGAYQVIGAFGQGIYVNPAARIVVAVHSVYPAAIDLPKEALQQAFVATLVRTLR